MVNTYLNTHGNRVADPTNLRAKHEAWLARITDLQGNVNYNTFKKISSKASELVTKFILDLDSGRNLAKGVRKGKRSYAYLVGAQYRLPRLIFMMESRFNKDLVQLNENEVLTFFAEMREGKIRTLSGKQYACVRNHSKVFCSFWRWNIRASKKQGIEVPDIVYDIDNSYFEKPKWEYFTLKDVERMSDEAHSFYYRTLVYFLFDSGIRAPKELMNVRAMDISPVPNSPHLFLEIRQDTAKTFGRKIKLMICSDILRKYIAYNKLKGEDFLFTKSYVCMSRMIALIGYKAKGVGILHKERSTKRRVSKGITLYDFRHNSVCHYLPIYKSENQMKYRYGWKSATMIDYYSERIGMKDTVSEADMLAEKPTEQSSLLLIAGLLKSQKDEFERRMSALEARYSPNQ